MAGENVQLLRAMYDAFNRGDLDALMDSFWPDAKQVVQVLGETHQNRDEIRRSFEQYFEVVEAHHTEPIEFIEEGDVVVVPVRLQGRLRHTGITDEMIPVEMIHVFELREGKIAWNWIGPDRDEAAKAVKLHHAGGSL